MLIKTRINVGGWIHEGEVEVPDGATQEEVLSLAKDFMTKQGEKLTHGVPGLTFEVSNMEIIPPKEVEINNGKITE